MTISDDTLAHIKNNPIDGCITYIEGVISNYRGRHSWTKQAKDDLIESYALLRSLAHKNLLPFAIRDCELTSEVERDCNQLMAIINSTLHSCLSISASQKLDMNIAKFEDFFGSAFTYEFSSGDLQRIQILINELRDLISVCDLFEADHKRRLLLRLEKLQAELHKKVSDLDKLWGLVGDAGVALGKFGDNAKPFVDRIKEITEIVWRTQARAEELPSNAPLPAIGRQITREE